MGNIDDIRELLNGEDPNGNKMPTWKVREKLGSISNFNGNQVILFEVVGMGHAADQILISTHDTRNETSSLTRWIVIPCPVVGDLLRGLLVAERGIADLEATDKGSWPALPIVVAEVGDPGQQIKILSDSYRNFLEVRLSKPKAGGPGQWLKFQVQNIRPAARLILQCHDAILAQPTDASNGTDSYSEPIPF